MWGRSAKDEQGRWERRCLERARRGDDRAFAELYRTLAPRLYREVLLPRLGQKQAAEDALAETFRALLERLDTIEPRDGGLWAWLATVATNKANDMHRVKHRTGRALASFESMLAPLLPTPADAEAELAVRREQGAIRQAVEQVLAAINPRYRLAIELRFLKEESRERCAGVLEISVGAFDVLLCRALKSFRKEWARIHCLEAEQVLT